MFYTDFKSGFRFVKNSKNNSKIPPEIKKSEGLKSILFRNLTPTNFLCWFKNKVFFSSKTKTIQKDPIKIKKNKKQFKKKTIQN